MVGKAEPVLGSQVLDNAKRVHIGFKEVGNAGGTYAAGAFASLRVDNALDMDAFKRNLVLNVLPAVDDAYTFEIIGIDAPIANALRRILLSEVPTIAIETVYMHDNNSIMPDEMLAHRLGLVPLGVDPRKLEFRKKGDPETPRNTLKFRLRAQCTRNTATAPRDNIAPPEKLYSQSKVLSGAVTYVPYPDMQGATQIQLLDLADTPKPVDDDIILVKMRPGQKLHVEMDAVKGIGSDHAKFSPVATVGYRMLPEVTLTKPFEGGRAKELVDVCPMEVFDIEDSGNAVVARPRSCTMCRECIRDPLRDKDIELTRKRDHFIYAVETTGALPAQTLVTEALSILEEKCRTVEAALDEAIQRRAPPAEDEDDADMEGDE